MIFSLHVVPKKLISVTVLDIFQNIFKLEHLQDNQNKVKYINLG